MNIHGTDIAVEVDGEGPAVLFVHGLGGTSNFYQVQADALAADHRVIRVDSAGAGRSGLADGISIESHADDLAAVLDALDVASAAAVGHSMGTLVVRALAARHPGRVSALALLGAVAEPAEAGRQAQRDRAAVLREKGTAAVAPGVVANALSEATRRDRPEVAAFVREMVMRQDPEGYARNCEALAAATDPGPVDPALPLLLVTGDEDKVGPPAVSHDLAAAHGGATVEIVPGIGHWTALEAAGPVTDHLRKFL
ncbi:alpha/beta fold hydrolase [Pseudonocardia sp. KRD-184]|uniref:Alpha/beta fold hydrolase n=1 Tax=Pseudonocardia oceani TaxID=2792013 RepID=A0ABS6U463_9PSEU|nr:alpha/beta hydrolase [Pseudonocardia oceani]MBW0090405.1 alpha/beta fold hydrolase [Pseudonocardia oceani]MBW0096691.1 alpha/beta fold hydrolase [Pseudonocardia oceani]MBW0108413.1 alpha/beta fold hydrolase [Pseudonocardia oceani]MBW0121081.1 alpha/beta fold hydrolase [Pseudonocardia oceani]MBW0126949.1 alpha/beta fold hydrolase [Pseudonocardia oceani]